MIDDFPMHYVGGGYWREKGVEVGVKADIAHGDNVLRLFALFVQMKEELKDDE